MSDVCRGPRSVGGHWASNKRGNPNQMDGFRIPRRQRQCCDADRGYQGVNARASRDWGTSRPQHHIQEDGSAIVKKEEQPKPEPSDSVFRRANGDWHEQRVAKCEELGELSFEDRLEDFWRFSAEDRCTLFLPNGSASLPPQSSHMTKEAMDQAASATEDWIREITQDNFHDDESSIDSYTRDSQPADADLKWRLRFCQALTVCPPMLIGFYNVINLADTAWCWCPCGKHMLRWRKFVMMEDIILEYRDKNSGCGFKGKKRPEEFVKHVEELASKGDVYHMILEKFLRYLFADFHEKGIRHIAFENMNTAAWRKAQSAMNKKINLAMDVLRKEAEEKKVLEKQLTKAREERKKLEELNGDLARQVALLEDIKKKIGAKEEPKLDAACIQKCKRLLGWCLSAIRDKHGTKKTNPIEVPQRFSLQRLFGNWYEEYGRKGSRSKMHFLFSPVLRDNEKATLLSKWDIRFELDEMLCEDIDMTRSEKMDLEAEIQAVDEGGPTREFFYQVHSQMAALKIGRVKLFENTKGGYQPTRNEILEDSLENERDQSQMRHQIRSYYRAIGRLLAHCFLHAPDPLTVSSNALPLIYQSILLYGRLPEDGCALVESACRLLDIEIREGENENKLYRRLGIEGLQGKEAEERFREAVQDLFVTQRSFALESLKDGFSLNGAIDWTPCFELVPLRAAEKIFFSRQSIDLDDLFDCIVFQNENLEHLEGEEREIHENKLEAYKETQDAFKVEMKSLFRRLSSEKEDPEFLNKFVHLCTGQAFLPHPEVDNFKITVEFNTTQFREYEYENWPDIHSCVNLIKIPTVCYNNDMEKFEEVLKGTMSNSLGAFDML